jgi:hypothetical protein
MLGAVKMLGGMFILRGIAAAYMSAFQAHAQMNPRVTGFDAFLADVFVCAGYADLIQMCTLRHRFPPIFGC